MNGKDLFKNVINRILYPSLSITNLRLALPFITNRGFNSFNLASGCNSGREGIVKGESHFVMRRLSMAFDGLSNVNCIE